MRVPIADCGFLPYGRTAFNHCDNRNLEPSRFQWQFAEPTTARFVTDGYLPHAAGPGQVALLLEPYFLHPMNYDRATEKPFDWVLTHNEQFVANQEHWLWYPAGGSWIRQEDWGLHAKTRNISLLLSHKQSMPGHKLRHAIRDRFGSHLDAVYGLDHRVTPFEALAESRYAIVVENEKSRSWFTEKLIDCLSVGTVPIYWGCPDVGRFFDARGIIQFNSLDELGNILGVLQKPGAAEAAYEQRRGALEANLETARGYRFCEDWIYEHYPFLFEGLNA